MQYIQDEASLKERLALLRKSLWSKGFRLSWHDPQSSLLEAAISRGDRRLGRVIYRAWQLGARFDAWNEVFDMDLWERAFAEVGLDPDFYARRERPLDEVLPWAHIDTEGQHRVPGLRMRKRPEGRDHPRLPDALPELWDFGHVQGFDA